ncbi:MAG: hypothetical protein VKP62_01515 [Candidatus Sericytochromatia bacterium]|nr:hypothetical protein [Candidatus Sericytochromatia bacterium]
MSAAADALQEAVAALKSAIASAPRAQIPLMEAVDAVYDQLDTWGEHLSDDQVLEAQLMIGHAESILTRYFGM